jgi:hypothetical protein
VNPDRALQEQIERYRRMTGEQRLAIALELHELSCNVAREGIRHQNPGADEAEVERLLRQRLLLAYQLPSSNFLWNVLGGLRSLDPDSNVTIGQASSQKIYS